MNKLHYYKTINPSAAKELQQELRQNITLDLLSDYPKYIAGADISFNRGSDLLHAAIVILELPGLQPVARSLASDETSFPYIPGLLAFREIPVLLKAWNQLKQKPDVLLLDGHGIAHPRRMGIATHFGIEVDHPTIGCAKNILTGTFGNLGTQKGDKADLLDGNDKIGMALRSRTNVNPIYVSPGYQCSFGNAYEIVMQSLTRYKLPKTSRLAHQWANKLRKGETAEGYVDLQ